MGRPATPPGAFGKIHFVAAGNGRVEARTRIRDFDGRVRMVSRRGSSKAAAERSLRAELTERRSPSAGGGVTGTTRLDALATAWLERPHSWATGTERLYRSVVKNQTNPVRDSATRISSPKKAARALTPEETERLVGLFASSERAGELDLPDLVDFMLATGCRIGEALAARRDVNAEGRPLLDLDAGTWEVNGTVVRIAGRGLTVQPRPKSEAGWRVVALPPFATRLLERRRAGRDNALVFPAPFAAGLRDPSNVSGDLRQLLDSFDCPECNGTGYRLRADGEFETGGTGRRVRCDAGPWSWVSSHTFRKTVATRLDEAGFSPRQVADQLGHANPSMTLDLYFGRHVVSAAAAAVLDRAG